MSEPQNILLEELLQAKFDPTDLKSFAGRGGKAMTYVEDETVMDRLDSVLGFGGWDVTEATPVSDFCVRLTLRTRHPVSGEWTSYTDFGYVTNTDDSKEPSKEPLKEAWTDAFRRVARLPGVARYVYAGEAPAPSAPVQTQAPQRVEQAAPVERPPLPPNTQPYQEYVASDGGSCPAGHGQWSAKPGGFSKRTNKPYDAFYACSGKTPNGGYCNEKPSKAWVDAHPIAA